MIPEKEPNNFVSFDSVMPVTPGNPRAANKIDNTRRVHWSIWSAIGLWLFSVLAIVILPNFAFIGYALIKQVPVSEWGKLVADPNAVLVAIAATAPAHLLTILATWALVTQGGKLPFFQTIKWTQSKRFNFGIMLAACLLLTIVLLLIGYAIVTLMGAQENDLERILKSSTHAVLVVAGLAALTAPFVEETIYRGVLYPAFEKRIGITGAITIVTLLFALVHVLQYVDFSKLNLLSNYSTILVILLLSLVLTTIRAWTNSLLPCFIIHTMFNGIQSIGLIVEALMPNAQAPTTAPSTTFTLWHLGF